MSTSRPHALLPTHVYQIYQHMDIGSNKPSPQDMAETPHHLVGVMDPTLGQDCSSGEYVRLAEPAIRDILARGKVPIYVCTCLYQYAICKTRYTIQNTPYTIRYTQYTPIDTPDPDPAPVTQVPIVVGGSTMWIDWLVKGVPDAPKADEAVKAEVEALIGSAEEVGAGAWDRALQELTHRSVDPTDVKRAESLPRNDWYRLRRYLEVLLTRAKERDSERGTEGPKVVAGQRRPVLGGCDVRAFFIAEERAHLYRVIDERCTQVRLVIQLPYVCLYAFSCVVSHVL